MKRVHLHALTSVEAQKSKLSSEDETEDPTSFKYVIRMFTFTKSE